MPYFKIVKNSQTLNTKHFMHFISKTNTISKLLLAFAIFFQLGR